MGAVVGGFVRSIGAGVGTLVGLLVSGTGERVGRFVGADVGLFVGADVGLFVGAVVVGEVSVGVPVGGSTVITLRKVDPAAPLHFSLGYGVAVKILFP